MTNQEIAEKVQDTFNDTKNMDNLREVMLSMNTGVRGYKSYFAKVSQSGTNAPTVIVLENSLSDTLVWTRDYLGAYKATLAGEFPDSTKVAVICSNSATGSGDPGDATLRATGPRILWYHNDVNSIVIETYLDFPTNVDDGKAKDGLLSETDVEIRIYA